MRTGGYSTPEERPNSFYPIFYQEQTGEITLEEKDGFLKILPEDSKGRYRVWRKTPKSLQEHLESGEIQVVKNRSGAYKVKIIDRIKSGIRPKSVWTGSKYDASSHGTKMLNQIFGGSSSFTFPKSLYAVYDCLYAVAGDSEKEHLILDYFGGSGTTGHAVIELNRKDEINRKYIIVEMGNYINDVIKPRLCKAAFSSSYKDGKPEYFDSGISHCIKYIRLESYEDAINNLQLINDEDQETALKAGSDFHRDYLLNYFLNVETDGSQSLLNIADFRDPTAYKMWIKKPGGDEQDLQVIDIIETFHSLIGLWVEHLATPQTFSAEFARDKDADLPEDQNTRLICTRLKQNTDGAYWFRLVEGYTLRVPGDKNTQVSTLIIWRKLTDDPEKDNAALQKYLEIIGVSTREKTYEVIYVNGSHTLPNPVVEGEQTKVRLIEEAFHQAMWAGA